MSCIYLYLADLDADPAVVERNSKRLQVEQSKTAKNQDVVVIKQLLSVTFEARLQQLLKLSDGKNRVQKTLQEWPIIGREIYVRNFNHLRDHCIIKFCITLEQFSYYYKLKLPEHSDMKLTKLCSLLFSLFYSLKRKYPEHHQGERYQSQSLV